MAKIGLPKGSGKRLKVREKSGNFEMDIEWQPCYISLKNLSPVLCILAKNSLSLTCDKIILMHRLI